MKVECVTRGDLPGRKTSEPRGDDAVQESEHP